MNDEIIIRFRMFSVLLQEIHASWCLSLLFLCLFVKPPGTGNVKQVLDYIWVCNLRTYRECNPMWYCFGDILQCFCSVYVYFYVLCLLNSFSTRILYTARLLTSNSIEASRPMHAGLLARVGLYIMSFYGDYDMGEIRLFLMKGEVADPEVGDASDSFERGRT